MPKRTSITHATVRPTKLVKVANVWSTIPDDGEKTKEFKPVPGGPKTRLQKTFVLNYNPRVETSISLNGNRPEVRFTTPDGHFFMTGDEFLDIAEGIDQGAATTLDSVLLEATEEGYRLVRYRKTESGMPDLFPISALELNKYAAKRLKSKLEVMSEHVCALRDSEEVINLMFNCIAQVYRDEYALANSLIPITEQFHELSRIVETYVPPVVVVKAFLDKMEETNLVCQFNYYNLCAVLMAQKYLIQAMLQESQQ